MRRTLRDIELIDDVEALPTESFSGDVFRLIQDGRDPTTCWHPEGRWDDGAFDVLYTATTEQGALAEVRYHLSQQQPFMPDFLKRRMFRIPVKEVEVVNLLDLSLLGKLGVDLSAWGNQIMCPVELSTCGLRKSPRLLNFTRGKRCLFLLRVPQMRTS